MEVFPTLPADIQAAFEAKDTPKLKAAFEALTPEVTAVPLSSLLHPLGRYCLGFPHARSTLALIRQEASYHFKRVVDSGLWVPAKPSIHLAGSRNCSRVGDDDEEEEEAAGEGEGGDEPEDKPEDK